ncbi:multicopper oxidase domain-containing protein [Geobacter sp. AOG1]|uniref:multicopper oxidase domain-containing protein n=1 Tax=Geobacter sp. AOG1 TaxID=1566346 RepID=UPI001CC755AA|nr:multicopper oxidase domain-containing protein [Geobacter sp. AOG1]GFE58598.1 multicopper oxidase [Geobacter sp. AOG1]
MEEYPRWYERFRAIAVLAVIGLSTASIAYAVPVPGGTVDPTSIPKYVTPLVIPPVMPTSDDSPAPAANYDIAVRQFKQQILPGGIWGSSFPNPLGTAPATVGPFPASTVWSYGRAADPQPDSTAIPGGAAGVAPAANSSFNYPAFTVENTSNIATSVRWINDLVADPVACAASPSKTIAACNFLPHLFSVDQTVHWANPTGIGCTMPMTPNMTDCHTLNAAPYTGPVPMVTHVHGAHVLPHSDGYPEAWWLPGTPGTKGIPANYVERGSVYTQANNSNSIPGSAYYSYLNSQPATTIWYHDHTLGMTRLNVYAGPAGFWLIRGGANDTATGVLPGPAPTAGQDPNLTPATRNVIREIPIAIQDRSFDWADALGNTLPTSTGATQAKLFYPSTRAFFDGFTGPYIGGTGTPAGPSDISGIANPEAFFNTMVVNGTTWPQLTVAPTKYRFRLLDGCDSRTLNLSMFVVTAGPDGKWGTADDVTTTTEVPFYQIGGDQGFLPKVVKITKGFTATYPGGGGAISAPVAAPSTEQGLLLGPAERADVIVDFTGLANGTHVRLLNTAPDSPFQGFPANLALYVPADPLTSGQVMDFIVDSTVVPVLPSDGTTTAVQNLVLPAETALGASVPKPRKVSLNELDSTQVCVEVDPLTGAIAGTLFSTVAGDPNFASNCALAAVVTAGNIAIPVGPRQPLLGTLSANSLVSLPMTWSDPLTELPLLNSTETWEIYNTTADAHPVHVHLVRFEVVNRQNLIPGTLVPDPTVGMTTTPQPNEMGYKDTVLALPGQVTRIKAQFNIAGTYVWHCHIIEHEDNEMMRPYRVVAPAKIGTFKGTDWYLDVSGNKAWDGTPTDKTLFFGTPGDIPVAGDWNGSGVTQVGTYNPATFTWYLDMSGDSAWSGTTADRIYYFGVTGSIPVSGNWSGLGSITRIGVYDPVTFKWYLDANGDGVWNNDPMKDYLYTFGAPGVIPVTGDWNGDGRTKVGYYDPATFTWHLDYDGDGVWNPAIDKLYTFGFAGVKPVTGDWDGSGKTKIGVYDPSNSIWYMDTDGNGAWNPPADTNAIFGITGSTPVTGNWQ